MDDQNQQNNQPADANQPPVQPEVAAQPQMAQPMPAQQQYPGSQENPGHTLGVVSLILAFFMPLVGLILGIIGLSKSKKAGMSNGMALAGVIISAISIVIGLIVLIFVFVIGAAAVTDIVDTCNELGPGTHFVDGVTYECGSDF